MQPEYSVLLQRVDKVILRKEGQDEPLFELQVRAQLGVEQIPQLHGLHACVGLEGAQELIEEQLELAMLVRQVLAEIVIGGLRHERRPKQRVCHLASRRMREELATRGAHDLHRVDRPRQRFRAFSHFPAENPLARAMH